MENNLEQRVDAIRSELIEILTRNRGNRDNAIAELNVWGIVDKNVIDNLLKVFSEKEEWNDIHNNTFNRSLQSTSGVDFTTDIDKTRMKAETYSAIFDEITSSLVWKKIANEIDMSEVDEDFLKHLSEHDINEEDINNPGLKLTYGYFLKNKQSQEQLTQKESEVRRLETWIESSRQEFEELTRKLDKLSAAYKALQETFKSRIDACEAKYQSALGVISSLRDRLSDLQHRGFFQFIKSKLMHQEVLPEGGQGKLSDTLKTKSEKLFPDILPGQSLEAILRSHEKTMELARLAQLKKENPQAYYDEIQNRLIGDDNDLDEQVCKYEAEQKHISGDRAV